MAEVLMAGRSESYPPAPLPRSLPTSLGAAVEAVRRGGFALVRDSARPERGAVLVVAAARASDDGVNFLATHARGLTAVAVLPDRAERLGLLAQADDRRLVQRAWHDGERWTVTVEARRGVTTGISAQDRAATIQALARADARADDFSFPGHVHPTIADPGGLVFRRGWSEAAIDLGRLAGLEPVMAFAQVLAPSGELATGDAVHAFAVEHAVPEVRIQEILAHRMATETFVSQLSQATLPTQHGPFLVRAFEHRLDQRQHLVVSLGDLRVPEPTLVRLHSECLTGDVLGSLRCDCGGQLDEALRRIAAAGRGAVLYLRQEGRGIGLLDKIRAYALQDAGRDTVEANIELGLPVDPRDYGLAAQILHVLGVARVRLMTNNPEKVSALSEFGIDVVERLPLEVAPSDANRAYLTTKKEKLGHLLDRV